MENKNNKQASGLPIEILPLDKQTDNKASVPMTDKNNGFPRAWKKEDDLETGLPEEYKNEIIRLGKNNREIDEKFAFLGPYSYETDFIECQAGVSSILTHRFFIGARLCRIREHEGQERFVEAINLLGIQKSTAYNEIAAAAKFINEGGEVKYPNLATLGTRKINTISYLGDDELEILEKGGSVNDLNLEDLKTQSTRALEKEVKKWKDEAAAIAAQLANKDKMLNDMDRQLKKFDPEGKPSVDWNARASEILAELNVILTQASQRNGSLNALIDEIDSMPETEWTKEEAVCLEHSKFVAKTIRDDADITVDRLDWMAPKVNASFYPGLNFGMDLRPAKSPDDADYEVLDVGEEDTDA